MAIVDTIRTALRIVSTEFDSEIENDIGAAIIDMQRVGIQNVSTSDPAIVLLLSLHAKSSFNFELDGEKYEERYRYMRDGISLYSTYNGGGENV